MKKKFTYSFQILAFILIIVLFTKCKQEEFDCTTVVQPEYELVE